MKKIETATELRNDLLEAYVQVTPGNESCAVADTKARVAGVIIKSAAVQVKYAQLRKETPYIPFLE